MEIEIEIEMEMEIEMEIEIEIEIEIEMEMETNTVSPALTWRNPKLSPFTITSSYMRTVSSPSTDDPMSAMRRRLQVRKSSMASSFGSFPM